MSASRHASRKGGSGPDQPNAPDREHVAADTLQRPARPPASTPRRPIDQALRHHQQGRLDEAEQIYQAILKRTPGHADALNLLGLVAEQRGQLAAAARLVERAIVQDGRQPQFHLNLARIRQQQGKLDAAEVAFQGALLLRPDDPEAHHGLGCVQMAQGHVDAAVKSYQRALDLQPDLALASYNLALAHDRQGRLEAATTAYWRAVMHRPDFVEAFGNLGELLLRRAQPHEALAACEQALLLQPGFAAAHNNRGMALASLGRLDEAREAYARAVQLRPDFAEAHNNLGSAFSALGRHDDAVLAYAAALHLQPGFAAAHYNLGVSLAAQGRLEAAWAAYARAVIHRPDHAEANNNLGDVLAQLGRFEDAASAFQRALEARPGYAEVHYNQGNLLLRQGHLDAAVERFDAALASRADYPEALNNLAYTLKFQGRLDAAVATCSRALETAPTGTGFLNLADLKRFAPGDPHLAAMEHLAQHLDTLPVDQQIALHFALGKAYDDCADPARAFGQFQQGNALKRQQLAYDEAATLALMAAMQREFNREQIESRAACGAAAPTPIFIVGMPRSGTTLLEQILASHPQVFGADERQDFPELASALGPPERLARLDCAALAALGERYLVRLQAAAPAVARIVDKMPVNFLYLGLIHLALPQARIIHMRRDPVDTCLSCYFQLFRDAQPHVYELGELGRYYRAYAQLLAHWTAVLPAETLLTVDYEALVDDLEGEARRVLAHCGLAWDPACLSFHTTGRAVRTASAVQVRQPLYRQSLGRARRYAEFLEPLRRALAGAAEAHRLATP